jgi:hypothetical protein
MENEEQVFAQRRGNEHRKGDWMECYGGQKFWPLDATPAEVDVNVIAHHLGRINRYNGAIKMDRYSVGEHAVAMCEWFLKQYPDEPYVAYQALHHDDTEAYIGDMIRPLKRTQGLELFTEIENGLWDRAIAPALNLPSMADLDPRVKEADSRILRDERNQVVGRSANEWGIDHLVPLGVTLYGHGPNYVKTVYLQLHHQLRAMWAL